MHHMYPRIPFYDYKTAYYALAGDLEKDGCAGPLTRRRNVISRP